jgi:hypothetical protein
LNSTESINDPYAAAKEKLNRENPRSWIWDDDGAEVGGYYWKSDFWTQKDATETEVRLIHTNAGYRAVWLFESPQDLRRVFKELDEEGLAEGDFVVIRRLPRREFVTDTGERRKFVPFEGTRIPAAQAEAEGEKGLANGAPSDEATESALLKEHADRDAALSELHSPIGGRGDDDARSERR